eukprot:CAMPEP_0170084326 /NCGR_PEP_ID=MMETSP0019_2-20121128/19572_1 /TAXON_ID=98059 /ORGANISM="Dinobryon sp., Strain UTEXLB2267" /LENGTH=225 /DNA_ID=CAMNT_0010300401 /DNA_START=190 /DNA_END=864 /DNA_ORIENTATION=+
MNRDVSDTNYKSLLRPFSRKKLSASLLFDDIELALFDSSVCLKTVAYALKVKLRSVLDVMSSDFDSLEVLKKLQVDDREIFETIMDQEVMPGVGNVIKCEGLFHSKVHPKSISRHIPSDILHQLIQNLQRFARDWYQKRKVRKDIFKSVYGVEVCITCRQGIRLVRSGILQRITYFCESCQILYTSSSVQKVEVDVNQSHHVLDSYQSDCNHSTDTVKSHVVAKW